jgi:Ser/Thr protein kinase RdoA (MazF antagonist)
MEQRIASRFTDDHVLEILKRYELQPGDLNALDGFESFIYEFTRDRRDFILRVGHSSRRSPEHYLGEVDWLTYLRKGGARVAEAVPSPGGNLLEEFDDRHGGRFIAMAFRKAPGGPPADQNLPADFPVHYGETIGGIHRLSMDYRPTRPEYRRDDWELQSKNEVEPWLRFDPDVFEEYRQLLRKIRPLPRDRASYGLIHQDAHMGNFFVDNGEMTLFDFDDCVYSWYVYDIAMVIFYRFFARQADEQEIGEFYQLFLEGYRREFRVSSQWLEKIPLFLKLREIDLYALLHRSFSDGNWPEGGIRNFMDGRRERILNRVPYLNYPWGESR